MSSTKIFIGSLPPGCKPEELRHLFEDYGVVVECDIMNRCGFVHMEMPEMAETAIAALNCTEFKGQMINVEHGRPKNRTGGMANGSQRGRGGFSRGMGRGQDGRGGAGSGAMMGVGRGSNRDAGTSYQRDDMAPPLRSGRGRGNFGGTSGHDNGFRPMRNDNNFRSQRDAPYARAERGRPVYNSGSYRDSQNGSPFNDLAQCGAGGNFRKTDDFTNDDYGNVNERPYDNWQNGNQMPNRISNDNHRIQYNENKNYSAGLSGNIDNSNNNYSARGQDRRGFALPAENLQEFGGSHRIDAGLFTRRHTAGQDFGAVRGGGGNNYQSNFGNSNNYSTNPGGSNNFGSNVNRGVGGGAFGQSKNNYQNDFPPLGGDGGRGGMNRSTPRQNVMPNRR